MVVKMSGQEMVKDKITSFVSKAALCQCNVFTELHP